MMERYSTHELIKQFGLFVGWNGWIIWYSVFKDGDYVSLGLATLTLTVGLVHVLVYLCMWRFDSDCCTGCCMRCLIRPSQRERYRRGCLWFCLARMALMILCAKVCDSKTHRCVWVFDAFTTESMVVGVLLVVIVVSVSIIDLSLNMQGLEFIVGLWTVHDRITVLPLHDGDIDEATGLPPVLSSVVHSYDACDDRIIVHSTVSLY